MLIALSGIVGVVLGAAVTFLLTRRHERRQARTAARLVLPELLQNRQRLTAALLSERWRHVDFHTYRWFRHETVIASALGKEWTLLATVYGAFMSFNGMRETHAPHERLREEDLANLKLLEESLTNAIALLQKWSALPVDSWALPAER